MSALANLDPNPDPDPDFNPVATPTRPQLGKERLRCVALDATGWTVMWGGWNNKFSYVNAASGSQSQRINSQNDDQYVSALIRSVAASADGKIVAVGGDERKCDVYRQLGSKYSLVASYQRAKVVWDVAVSSGGDLIALGDYDGCVAIYDLAVGVLVGLCEMLPQFKLKLSDSQITKRYMNISLKIISFTYASQFKIVKLHHI